MPRFVATAEVEDVARWEEGFRSHLDLFDEMTVTATHYTVTDDNHVAVYHELADLDTFFSIMESPAARDAMARDGVRPGTLKVFVLDKELSH
jgi:hypothetical protein